jgi:hypothetical protein
MEPWSRGDYSYATDGYTIIMVPCLVNVEENPAAPDAEDFFKTASRGEREYFPIPELPPREIITCPVCGGKLIFEGDPCDTCIDEEKPGKIERIVRVQIGEALFNRNYLERLQSLPGVVIGPKGPEDPAWIKFDGGDGLIMPIRRKD